MESKKTLFFNGSEFCVYLKSKIYTKIPGRSRTAVKRSSRRQDPAHRRQLRAWLNLILTKDARKQAANRRIWKFYRVSSIRFEEVAAESKKY